MLHNDIFPERSPKYVFFTLIYLLMLCFDEIICAVSKHAILSPAYYLTGCIFLLTKLLLDFNRTAPRKYNYLEFVGGRRLIFLSYAVQGINNSIKAGRICVGGKIYGIR